ncbi:Hypothetical protein R9X50_00376100 [Acrodontium crateriforme]|uniref:Copper-fist domain-containing protein n=1 Tax=Acrodontium crateriforme TaxID=150365 RepID=A0AAQ3M344_9PEZI|nr:Hypothetical protein R9X50_00376100 [Acrodontium crateriforme]
MVVKPDGTKWACLSCLKGHRVSGCNHTDRELQLVPKKGRPVTQCQHCRQERKKRSAHVKCDCGETEKPHHSKEKCIHLREAEEKLKSTEEEVLQQGCCCHHGGDCNCSTAKKDVKDKAPHGPAVSKPRLETMKSDPSITVFQNGHHKPVHRNHAAHECGMPYKLPSKCHGDTAIARAARRSVDSLALDGGVSMSGPPSVASFTIDRRTSKSEQPSPRMSPMDTQRMGSIDMNGLTQTHTNRSMQSTDNEYYGFPIEGADSYDPWSALPSGDSSIMPNNNPFGVWPTSIDMSGAVQPALTAASSGTQSEIDEIPQMDDFYGFGGFGMPSIQEDDSPFGSNNGANLQQPNRRSLPPNFFSAADAVGPNQNGDWQIPIDDHMNDAKSNSFDNGTASNFDDGWQAPPLPLITAMPHRSVTVLPNGRPASHSIGPGSAPNNDIIQQLFPGIDVNGNMFESPGPDEGRDLPTGTDKLLASVNGSSPMEFGPTDEEVGFTSQAWTDGSMTVPTDAYTFDEFDQNYSTPDFDNNWTR